MSDTARIGRRQVRRIGYGAMQLGDEGHRRGGWSRPARAGAELLRCAVELGVQLIDTAEFYGDGYVNRLLRDTLSPYPEQLLIATKVGAVRAGRSLAAAQRPAELRAQVQDNLRSLGQSRLGLVNLRRVDSPPGIVAEGKQIVDLDDQLAELIALRDEGLVEAIGLSAVTAEQVRQAAGAGVVCVQNRHNVLQRASAELLAACTEQGVAFMPFFPLGSAMAGLPGPVHDATVVDVAGELGATPQQVCLAWLLAQDPQFVLIPGTSSIGHLGSNLAAGEVELTADQVARLDTLGAPGDRPAAE